MYKKMLQILKLNLNIESKNFFPNYNYFNNSLTFGLTFFGVFCMWLMWFSVYMHQMNPLITPIMETGHE